MYSMIKEKEIEPFPKDAKREKRMIANKFNNLHKRGFNEFDLLHFKKWTRLLPDSNFKIEELTSKSLSGDSNIMSGDNSGKEGDPDQEYARKKYS